MRAKAKALLRQVDVPLGKDGVWEVSRFTVTKEDAEHENLQAAIQGFQGRRYTPVPMGSYTSLSRAGGVLGRTIVMSDTPSEIHDHWEPVYEAKGRVFIAGLGIGVVLQAVLDKPEVKHVTVLELSEQVIRLVAPHYLERYGSERLTVLQGDVFAYTPPRGTHKDPFDIAWFDIWDTKNSGNLADFTKIKRRWSRWAKWRGFWAEAMCRYHARRGRY